MLSEIVGEVDDLEIGPTTRVTTARASLGAAIDLSQIDPYVSMSATNPNSSDLSASEVSSHVVVDRTHDVGTVTVPETITLPAGKTTTFEVPLTMKWSDMGVLAQLAVSTGAVPYSVDGTLDMGGNLIHVGVPFHLDGTITQAQIVGAMMNSMPKLP